MNPRNLSLIAFALPFALAIGCGDTTNNSTDMASAGTADLTAAGPDLAVATQPVTIRFAAEVGGKPFACGQSYTGVGKTAAPYTVIDYRVFVHDVRLVDGAGKETPVALDQDGVFQLKNLALLDFEDGTNGCASGTKDKHESVTGRVPVGSYTGLRFTVGVPFELNHGDPAQADSPLNITSMEWVWQYGYKFIRIDGKSGNNPFLLHLGSTGCASAGEQQPPKTPCANPNRFEVAFDAFDAGKQTVVADVGTLLATSDITTNTANTAPGCMSELEDPECAPILPRLGIAFQGMAAEKQRLFTVR